MNQEYLEILIGKYIDSEITPAEELMLQDELHSNEQSQELFDEYAKFSIVAAEVVQEEVIESGKSCNDIFENAWDQSNIGSRVHFSWPSKKFMGGLASGIAAGFMLALVVITGQVEKQERFNGPMKGSSVQSGGTVTEPLVTDKYASNEEELMPRRTVDYYYYTDDNGEQYIIENYRKSNIMNSSYEGGL